MSGNDEFEVEPIPGLPENLPEGEQILWQGRSQWIKLAIRALHVRKVAVYFALLIAWRTATMAGDGQPMPVMAADAAWLALLALLAIGILGLIANLSARMTVYTITNRRLVIRHGIALPMTINIPYKVVRSAGLRRYMDGTGDIPVTLVPGLRIAYLALWPHARPWHVGEPQPMLRSVADGAHVAEVLSRALAGAAGVAAVPVAARSPDESKAADHGMPDRAVAAM